MRSICLAGLGGAALLAAAQQNVPVNGPHERAEAWVAFTHATVHVAPGETLHDATVLIQGDRVREVGKRVRIPANAVMHDLSGLHLWPGLVDPFSDLGLPRHARAPEKQVAGARYWNRAIRASEQAGVQFLPDEKRADELRGQGFTTVVTHR